MNILVTGSNGQLGNAMRIVSRQSGDNYLFTDVAELNITDAAAVDRLVDEQGIDLVVNCAAYTNVDKAESEPALAESLNAEAVGYLAAAMKRRDGVLVHVSTDYVFGGIANNTPCTEETPCAPLGVYGETKLRGEQAVLCTGCRHLIIRTAWLYSEFGRNFLKTMLDLTASRPTLKVVFDQAGTPTYAGDLAAAIFTIVENRLFEGHEGIYHFSNEGVCSWYDFAKTIAALAGHDGCEIEPCHSDEFPSPVTRPAYSVLDKTKIKNTFGLRIPYWTDSLKTCIENIRK